MDKKVISLCIAILLCLPSTSFAAGLTQQQAQSLIGVVQASPLTPANVFVPLITAFSNITVNQASSLITVVKSAPGVAASAFIDLLISFTVDNSTSQSVTAPIATSSSNQQNSYTQPVAYTPPPVTVPTQPVPTTPPSPTLTTLLQDDFNSYSYGQVIGQGGWFNRANGATYIVQGTTTYDGGRALYSANSGADSVVTKSSGTALADGREAFYVRTENASTWDTYSIGENVQLGVFQGSWDGPTRTVMAFMKDGHVAYIDPRVNRYVAFDMYNPNSWNLAEIEWRSSDKTAHFRVNGGAWSNWIPFVGAASFTGFDTVGFVTLYLGGGGVYIDNFH